MEETILNGVGKKMRNAYLNGQVPESTIIAMYKKNKKEADSFSVFGFKQREIEALVKEAHNPLLKRKLQECLITKREISTKSNAQNKVSLAKLETFKKDACGMGLRKVIKKMNKIAKRTKDPETKLLLLLLETEYANLSAKQHKGDLKKVIYERKTILLYQMAYYLENLGWKYGINDEAGKNACYLVYVYLPNDVQLTWHCNEYDIYEYYPFIDAQWDGQVCKTLDKILEYIEMNYYQHNMAA
jgi:hypothetical protein